MNSSKISRIPNIIWPPVAIISISVIFRVSLSSRWFWVCWEVGSGALVAVGCIGELILFQKPAKPGDEEHHRGQELQFICMVAFGVTMELFSLFHSIPEAFHLEKDITSAIERTRQLESANLMMAKELKTISKIARVREINNPQLFVSTVKQNWAVPRLSLFSIEMMRMRIFSHGNCHYY